MKKIHALPILALSPVLLLAGCGEVKGMSLDDAKIQAVNQVFYTDYAIDGVQGDFDLITESIVEDYHFTVKYTAGELKEYKGVDDTVYHFVTISEDGKTAKVVPPNKLDDNLKFVETYGSYAQCYIEASFSYNNEVFNTKRYNIKVNAVSTCTIKELYSESLLKEGISVEVNAYYTGAYNNDKHYQGAFAQDGDAGILIYGLDYSKLPSGLQVGDPIHISGATSPYNGLQELKNCTITKLTDETAIGKISKPVTIEFNESTEFEYHNLSALIHAAGTVSKYKLDESTADRRKIKGYINVGSAKIYVYADEKYMSPDNFAVALEKFTEGATVDVTSFAGYYNTTGTFNAKSIQLVNPIFAD